MTDTSMTDNSEPVNVKRFRIMIVEDDALVALGIRCTWMNWAMRCAAWPHRNRRLWRSQERRGQNCIMDIRLRGPTDGIDTARRLRAEYGIRSVYLSAYTDHQTMSRITSTYPLGFVQKPYSAVQLRIALDLAVRRLGA